MRTSRPSSIRLAIASAITALALVLAPTLTATAAPPSSPPGNSAAAKACQKGGWMQLSGSEDASAGFVDQSACVSYAAGGGVLVPLQEPEGAHVVVTIAPYDGTFCAVTITVVDPVDGLWYAAKVPVYTSLGLYGYFTPLFPPGTTVGTGFKLDAGQYMGEGMAGAYDITTSTYTEMIDMEVPTTPCAA